MQNKTPWSTLIMSTDRADRVRAPMLVGIVVGLHVAALGTFLFIQGCGTTRPKDVVVEPPPAPIMPPSEQQAVTPLATRPALQPPVAVEPAPAIVEPAAGQSYKIQSGDSLSKIAARFGVSSREIAELNAIKDPNKIRIGQTLLLPSYASNVPSQPKAAKSASAPRKPKAESAPAVAGSGPSTSLGAGEYIVKSGDSLSRIASRNGTTVKALREVNNLKSDMLKIGQKLVLPAGATASAAPSSPAPAVEAPAPAPSPEPAPAAPAPAVEPAPAAPVVEAAPAPAEAAPVADTPFEYEVKPGETLDDVASKFAVLKADILSLNGITDESAVTAGTKVKIPLSAP
jgi:LysM repeat protein